MKISLEWLREYADLDAPRRRAGPGPGRHRHRGRPCRARRRRARSWPGSWSWPRSRESTRGVRLADIDAGGRRAGAPGHRRAQRQGRRPGRLRASRDRPPRLPRAARGPLDVRRPVQLPGDAALRRRAGDRRGRERPPDPRAWPPRPAPPGGARPRRRPRRGGDHQPAGLHVPPRDRPGAGRRARPSPSASPPTDLPEGLLSATASASGPGSSIEDPVGCRRFTALVIEGVAPGSPPTGSSAGCGPSGCVRSAAWWTSPTTSPTSSAIPSTPSTSTALAALDGGGRPVTLTVRRAQRRREPRVPRRGHPRARRRGHGHRQRRGRRSAWRGIIGGASTAIGDSTRTVLLEAANWEPSAIRATSRRHGDPDRRLGALRQGPARRAGARSPCCRAAALIADIAGGHVLRDPIDEHPSPLPPLQPVEVTGAWLGGLLGYAVDVHEASTVLVHLGFAVEQEGDRLTVHPPYFRRDVRIPEDVAEEVGRGLGYGRLPSTLPGHRTPVRQLAAEGPSRIGCATSAWGPASTRSSRTSSAGRRSPAGCPGSARAARRCACSTR